MMALAAVIMDAGMAHAKDKVIEAPVFVASNTQVIEVSRVVKSDTATVLHVYAKFYPMNNIRIAREAMLTDNNGRTYALRGADGITPGKWLRMPESGETEFRLVFEPVDPRAVSVDFSEGTKKRGDWQIWGLRLDGAKRLPAPKLPSDIVVHKVDKKTPLPVPMSKFGAATVRGRLLDYRPEMRSTVRYSREGVFSTNFKEPERMKIGDDGTFELSLPVAGTTPVTLSFPELDFSVSVFVEPGATTDVCVNLREWCRKLSKFHSGDKPYGLPLYVKGPLAGVAQELAIHAAEEMSRLPDDVIAGMTLAEYKDKIMSERERVRAVWSKLPVSRATTELALLETDIATLSMLHSAPIDMTYARINKKIIPEDKFSECLRSLKEQTADFYPKEVLDRINDRHIALVSEYSRCIGLFGRSHIKLLFGTDDCPYLTDYEAWATFRGVAKDFIPLENQNKSRFKSLPEAYRMMIGEADKELAKKLEEQKSKTGYNVCEVPAVADSLVFDSIAARYRGKVVLVDIWETWCGPCRSAHAKMAGIKKELAGKDVVFVYLVSGSSPESSWKYMIADIPGEHYRLSDKQSDAVMKRFKTSAVPTYIILDRSGKPTYTSIGFRGVTEMKKEIEKNM